MTDNVVPLSNPEKKAREAFSNHVQSVAFQISLSRAMIEELHVIRDWGYPRHYAKRGEQGFDRETVSSMENKWDEWDAMYPRVMRHAMTHRPALERRGLVYSTDNPKLGERSWKLTHAGKLICELLVEAGLLAPAKRARKRA